MEASHDLILLLILLLLLFPFLDHIVELLVKSRDSLVKTILSNQFRGDFLSVNLFQHFKKLLNIHQLEYLLISDCKDNFEVIVNGPSHLIGLQKQLLLRAFVLDEDSLNEKIDRIELHGGEGLGEEEDSTSGENACVIKHFG